MAYGPIKLIPTVMASLVVSQGISVRISEASTLKQSGNTVTVHYITLAKAQSSFSKKEEITQFNRKVFNQV